jgi:hypothetical protein
VPATLFPIPVLPFSLLALLFFSASLESTSMSNNAILFPVFVQVFLTFVVMVAMGAARRQSMIEKRQSLNDAKVRLGTVEWSENATKRSRNFSNQFELPVLFYAVVAFALLTRQADLVMVTLAWVFALTRIAHAYIHIGSNRVQYRGLFYLVGAAALLAMWVVLAMRTMLG